MVEEILIHNETKQRARNAAIRHIVSSKRNIAQHSTKGESTRKGENGESKKRIA